jgi:hypothetical protein
MMKKTGIFFLALAAVVFLAGPSFAGKGKKALKEDDLDRITAAGEPKIIQLSDVTLSGTTAHIHVTFVDAAHAFLLIDSNSQTTLRALTLNNVSGENQLGTGINVTSTLGGGAVQSNSIKQSWGSVKVTGITTVSVDASASATASVGTVTFNDKCVGINVCNPGSRTANAAAAAVAIAVAYPEYMSADVIIHLEDIELTATGNNHLTLEVRETPEADLFVNSNSQTTLAALVVNNVVGRNQVASGINVASAGGVAINSPSFVLEGIANGVFSVQSNEIMQYRGTPLNAPQPIAVAVGAAAGFTGTVRGGFFSPTPCQCPGSFATFGP